MKAQAAQHNRRTLSSAASTLQPDTAARHVAPQPPPPGPPPSSFDDSSAALTVIVVLSALLFLGFFSLYIRHFARGSSSSFSYTTTTTTTTTTTVIFTRPTYSSSPLAAMHKGLDPATIRSMPSFAYSGGATKYQVECSVCLSEFEDGDTVKVIPQCDHLFHAQCIDRWLYSHASCPLCRATWLLDVRG